MFSVKMRTKIDEEEQWWGEAYLDYMTDACQQISSVLILLGSLQCLRLMTLLTPQGTCIRI
jgi:hypothetical protein